MFLKENQEQNQFNNLATEKIPPNPPLQSGGIKEIESSIFATIAYYDYFNYPLMAGEIYQYLIKNPKSQNPNPLAARDLAKPDNQIPNPKTQIQTNIPCHPEFISGSIIAEKRDGDKILKQVQDDKINQELKPSFSEILEILDSSEKLKKFIGSKNGFYFLAGREETIKQRIQKKKLMDQKYKKVKWILRFIAYLPFVRLIMLSGSMGLGNPLKESDIDLLIVAKHGRIWTARALLTFFTLLFGAYRHTGKTENRLCLNHYITDKSLGIDFGNLYKAEEYLNLLPLAGDLNIYNNFFKENAWMQDYAHSSQGSTEKNLRAMPLKGISLKMKYFFEFLLFGAIGDYFEKNVKKFQVYFIEKNPLTKNSHARIRYDDNNLVFHPVLIEPEVIGKWEEKMREFNNF